MKLKEAAMSIGGYSTNPFPEPKKCPSCGNSWRNSDEVTPSNFCLDPLHESSPEPELNVEAVRRALMEDFIQLYTPGFTADYQVQREIRSLELGVMDFSRLLALIQQVSNQRVEMFANRLKASTEIGKYAGAMVYEADIDATLKEFIENEGGKK
jgi:hypothetical protein